MTDRDDVRRALAGEPHRAGLVLDFDGVLAPIVDDPGAARLLDGTAELLDSLSGRLAVVALLSGRPVELLTQRVTAPRVVLLGAYGAESHRGGETSLLPVVAQWVPAVAQAGADLVDALEHLEGVHVEAKQVAVAVHWRRSPDHAAAARQVGEVVDRVAEQTGLVQEPGKLVLELRAPVGEDKGTALRRLATEQGLGVLAYAGDDRGDLPAFAVAAELGGHALVVAGAGMAQEVNDVAGPHFDGPEDFAGWLRELDTELSGDRAR